MKETKAGTTCTNCVPQIEVVIAKLFKEDLKTLENPQTS